MPSQAELQFKITQQRKEDLYKKKENELLDRYGGKEYYHNRLPNQVLETEISGLEEYERQNKKRVTIKSKYIEDLYQNAHTQVWGSYWHKHFGWGYKCCLGIDNKGSCQGKEGVEAGLKREYDWEQEEQKRWEQENPSKLIIVGNNEEAQAILQDQFGEE